MGMSFFKLSKEDLSEIVKRKRLPESINNIEDLGKAFHRNILTGNLEIRKTQELINECEMYLQRENHFFIRWCLSVKKIFKMITLDLNNEEHENEENEISILSDK